LVMKNNVLRAKKNKKTEVPTESGGERKKGTSGKRREKIRTRGGGAGWKFLARPGKQGGFGQRDNCRGRVRARNHKRKKVDRRGRRTRIT